MIFDAFLDLFRYQFFGSILEAFYKLFSCLFDTGFGIDFVTNFLVKMVPKALNTSMGVRVAFHDRRTDDLLCVLAFILFASTFSRRIVSVSNKMQYFNVTPPDERA